MTTGTNDPAPEVVLQLANGGSTLTEAGGNPRPLDGATVDDARIAGLAYILKQAASRGYPVRFDAHDPNGDWQLLAHPDGHITERQPESDSNTSPALPTSTTTDPVDEAKRVEEVATESERDMTTSAAAAAAGITQAERDGHATAAYAPPSAPPAPPSQPSYDSTYVMQRIVPVTRIPKATRGWRGLLGIGPSKRELEERADREAACQTFGRPVTIVVADPRGGSGKTTTSILLAGAFGNARGGGVLVLENHELRGTMHLRTNAQGKDRTIRDLLGAQNYRAPSGEVVRVGDLSAYVRHQVSGQFDVMVSETKRDRALTRGEFENVHDLGARFYSLIVVDTANDESAENWRAAVQRADALVVPLKWRNDYSLPAIEMLEELQASDDPRQRDLVRRAVIVASHNQGDLDFRCQQHLKPYFLDRTKAVIEIEPDPHIAEGNVIQHDQLSVNTRRQAERLAAQTAGAIRDGLDAASTAGG